MTRGQVNGTATGSMRAVTQSAHHVARKGSLQIWPTKRQGLWDFPLQSIPLVGTKYSVLWMDYNIMYNQIGPNPDSGNPARRGFQAK
jgi:hypothetical protein